MNTQERNIKTQRLRDPVVEAAECGDECTLEKEHGTTSWHKVEGMVKWKKPFWNAQKPIDVLAAL